METHWKTQQNVLNYENSVSHKTYQMISEGCLFVLQYESVSICIYSWEIYLND